MAPYGQFGPLWGEGAPDVAARRPEDAIQRAVFPFGHKARGVAGLVAIMSANPRSAGLARQH